MRLVNQVCFSALCSRKRSLSGMAILVGAIRLKGDDEEHLFCRPWESIMSWSRWPRRSFRASQSEFGSNVHLRYSNKLVEELFVGNSRDVHWCFLEDGSVSSNRFGQFCCDFLNEISVDQSLYWYRAFLHVLAWDTSRVALAWSSRSCNLAKRDRALMKGSIVWYLAIRVFWIRLSFQGSLHREITHLTLTLSVCHEKLRRTRTIGDPVL